MGLIQCRAGSMCELIVVARGRQCSRIILGSCMADGPGVISEHCKSVDRHRAPRIAMRSVLAKL